MNENLRFLLVLLLLFIQAKLLPTQMQPIPWKTPQTSTQFHSVLLLER